MKKILKNRLVVYLILAIGIICLLAAVFYFYQAIYFLSHKPPHLSRVTDTSLIQDWMSIGYVSRMYRVPQPVLYQDLGIPPDHSARTSLKNLAIEMGIDQTSLIQKVKEAITSFQTTHPVPSAPVNNQ